MRTSFRYANYITHMHLVTQHQKRCIQYRFDGFGSDATTRKTPVRPIRRTLAHTCVSRPIKQPKAIHLVTPQLAKHAPRLTMRAIALSKWPTPWNVRTLGRPFRLLFGCFDRIFFCRVQQMRRPLCKDQQRQTNSAIMRTRANRVLKQRPP